MRTKTTDFAACPASATMLAVASESVELAECSVAKCEVE